ncbi:MAG: hypothetical protein DRG09_07280 [Epsilonproteobacteria bacterium]|nr:MAG: hypothetical protein DRG09_07280 [Campylobacterota bacterium]
MHKIFLLIIGISTFLLAEYMSESDILIQQNLDDIKNKYHIQDETPSEVVKIEKAMPQVKEELPKPVESLRTGGSAKVNEVIPSVKQALPLPNEPVVSENEDKLESIRRELGIKQLTGKEKKLDAIRSELNINYETPKKESYLDKHVTGIQEALHMDGEIEGEYSFSNTVNDLKKTLHLEGDSSFGMPSFGLPSLFGEKKKKKKDKGLFGIDIPGISIPGLGGVKDTGQSIYKGMKYSGESAEMMSGMMYNSSKMYNTMFGLFDDSPFNIFEEEEEDSMFDFIQGGNSIMRMFE